MDTSYIQSPLHDALVDAGASDDKAKKAAHSVAGNMLSIDRRLIKIETMIKVIIGLNIATFTGVLMLALKSFL